MTIERQEQELRDLREKVEYVEKLNRKVGLLENLQRLLISSKKRFQKWS